jgi:hypothetical protein
VITTPQVAHDDGSLLACAINAAVAALVDAGVAMRGLVSAVCLALTPSLTVLLDPLATELAVRVSSAANSGSLPPQRKPSCGLSKSIRSSVALSFVSPSASSSNAAPRVSLSQGLAQRHFILYIHDRHRTLSVAAL